VAEILETVLLLALPASGKSEVRKYLATLSPEVSERDFHMGPTVQLDDFPYVHLMRRIDDELVKLGRERVFFQAPEKPFRDGRSWGTLIELVNEDHADLVARRVATPASAARHLFARLDRAARAVGARAALGDLDPDAQGALAASLEAEARAQLEEKHAGYPDTLAGKTLVIEFARGGPHGAAMPLEPPLGYAYSLSRLSSAILERARILYIWVTPEESRRKNAARADPSDPGSILHHGVPIEVMMNDYGCDDMDWLEAAAERPGTVTVRAHGRTFHLPVVRFDNRVDRTSFVRNPRAAWRAEEVRLLHEGLRSALEKLARAPVAG
jgi:hypothetical protein